MASVENWMINLSDILGWCSVVHDFDWREMGQDTSSITTPVYHYVQILVCAVHGHWKGLLWYYTRLFAREYSLSRTRTFVGASNNNSMLLLLRIFSPCILALFVNISDDFTCMVCWSKCLDSEWTRQTKMALHKNYSPTNTIIPHMYRG